MALAFMPFVSLTRHPIFSYRQCSEPQPHGRVPHHSSGCSWARHRRGRRVVRLHPARVRGLAPIECSVESASRARCKWQTKRLRAARANSMTMSIARPESRSCRERRAGLPRSFHRHRRPHSAHQYLACTSACPPRRGVRAARGM